MESLPEDIYNHILNFIPLGKNPTAALIQHEIDKCNTDDDVHICEADSDDEVPMDFHAYVDKHSDEHLLNDWINYCSLNILYANRNSNYYCIKNRMSKLNCRDKHPELYFQRYAN